MQLFFRNSSINFIVLFLFCLLPLSAHAVEPPPKSIAFYYHQIDSVRELLIYDRVVVNASALTARQLTQLKHANVEVYAYLSIGELSHIPEYSSLENHVLKKNSHWQSHIMDMNATSWQHYLLDLATDFKIKGFDGIFLDTLDSYQMIDKSDKNAQLAGLLSTLEALNTIHPSLIFNRGFELIPLLSFKPHAVAAESLFSGYNAGVDSYFTTKPSDSQWLINKLNSIKQQAIEIIVIDYIDGQDREQQKKAAHKILDLDFTPYVSDGLLKQFGTSTVVPVARRVLTIYNGKNTIRPQSDCHRILSTIIEYYGYIPECADVHTTNFSTIDITKYQQIVIWLSEENYDYKLLSWLNSTFGQIKIVFFEFLPDDHALLTKLGLKKDGKFSGQLNISQAPEWFKLLVNLPNANYKEIQKYQAVTPLIKQHLTITDSSKKTSPVVLSAPWGGAVLSPLLFQRITSERKRWLIPPFKLMELIFDLPAIPVPDITTESGNRILTAHIDGDGFPSRAWMRDKPFSAEVILNRILKKYPLPQTVSVIEGEISKGGLYPELSKQLEEVAKEIFRLDNVEIASHTFSHPFFWDKRIVTHEKKYGDSLPIPNYTIDYDREISGSVEYINQRLAPKNKKVKILLWSGTANPTQEIIEKTLASGLLNVNGGSTYVVNGDDSMTKVYPHILCHKNEVQVYPPIIYENLYTNLWTENFSGYQRVIETFKILGSPKRLKPMSIYYHMYSGVYDTSVAALDKIYQWTMAQPSTPLYLSDYALRARSLYETGIGKPLNNDNDWLVVTTGVKSLRLSDKLGYLSLPNSNIADWTNDTDGQYISLISPRTHLVFSPNQTTNTYLDNVNGIIESWHTQGSSIKFKIKSYVAMTMTLKNAKNCRLVKSNIKLKRKILNNNFVSYSHSLSRETTLIGELECH